MNPIFKLCIVRYADYTVCKSILLLNLDIKINYKCYFLINRGYYLSLNMDFSSILK